MRKEGTEILNVRFFPFRESTPFITTQLGLSEWPSLLGDEHLSAAIIDRITENCTVFNMAKCVSMRRKNISHATQGADSP